MKFTPFTKMFQTIEYYTGNNIIPNKMYTNTWDNGIIEISETDIPIGMNLPYIKNINIWKEIWKFSDCTIINILIVDDNLVPIIFSTQLIQNDDEFSILNITCRKELSNHYIIYVEDLENNYYTQDLFFDKYIISNITSHRINMFLIPYRIYKNSN